MKRLLVALSQFLLVFVGSVDADERPNVIVIVSDDQGWSDVGFNGCKEIPTPNLDALAKSGVIFESGYASHPYCSPSRAGLLTGRYQQRFGHECNPGANEDGTESGLPLSETLLSDLFQKNGYRTAAIGKWHLGDDKKFWPTQRGFDEWFGFSGGGSNYFGSPGKKPAIKGVLRNGNIVPVSELTYLTDDFSTEAVKFVERNQDNPFFLYLAYNAPHAPDQATKKHLEKTAHIEYGGRAVYGAMIAGMDEGIGRVVDKLEELNLRDNTLIFFYSDNGGRKTHAVNFPFRGHKGMLFEGGIRVPFCCSWPKTFPSDQRYKHPVSALDTFPTTLAAAKIEPPKIKLDGVDLVPFLDGSKPSTKLPHQTLYWRYACGDDEYGFAVRDGDQKLVYSVYKNKHLLFDLAKDPWERKDLAVQSPAAIERLTEMYQRWSAEMVDPKWLDPHGENVEKESLERQKAVKNASRGEKK
jgi:arylsulfatase A-like enzyme